LTRNEVLTSRIQPDRFILARVESYETNSRQVHSLRQPFPREPAFGVASVSSDVRELRARAEAPS